MCGGVGKSGWPMPRLMMSRPRDASSVARASTAKAFSSPMREKAGTMGSMALIQVGRGATENKKTKIGTSQTFGFSLRQPRFVFGRTQGDVNLVRPVTANPLALWSHACERGVVRPVAQETGPWSPSRPARRSRRQRHRADAGPGLPRHAELGLRHALLLRARLRHGRAG